MDFEVKNITVRGKSVRLVLWDTAGQERFRVLNSVFYRGSNGIVLVYDVTNETSFNNIKSWSQEVDKYAEPGVVRALVANKIDKLADQAVSKEAGEKLAQSLNMFFVETSAKTTEGIHHAFDELIMKLMKKKDNEVKRSKVNALDELGLEEEDSAEEYSSCCF